MEFLSELWVFMKAHKKYWLWPLIVILWVLGILVVFSGGSALAPFIYAIF